MRSVTQRKSLLVCTYYYSPGAPVPSSLARRAPLLPLDVGFHTYSGLEYIDCNIVNLVFDKSTGKLRYVTGHFCRGEEMDDVSDEYLRTHLHAKCDYMSRQTLVPAKWSMQENRYVPSSP